MFTGPVGGVESFFLLALSHFGNFYYWPGAIGPLLTSRLVILCIGTYGGH